ncbi:hypothetical protein [Tropicimonas sp. S265A]|uniref:hypothetical protein n=1 Tax=Tropicimonas sp. S265A TaxID=3415134 RepID=UPI003C7C95C2
MSERMERALDGWGPQLPDWIFVLVEQCEIASQNKVAKRISYTPAVVSQVIGNCYAGQIENVEQRVRAVFMNPAHNCPAMLEEISAETCLHWQLKATKPFRAGPPLMVRMYRACPRCAHFKQGTSHAGD